MAGTSPTVAVNVIVDTKKFSRGMQDSEKILKNFAQTAAVAFAAAGAAAIAFTVQSVKSASDLEQSIGGVESVFKEYANTVEQSSKDAAQALGLSRNSYNQIATIIGTQLKAAGTTIDQLAGKTDDLIGISADLAATFGGPVTDAATAVTSALRGEFEPLRRYGISLSVAAIEAEALAMTNKTLAKDLTAAEKSAAAQSLIFKGAADATGAFERESDTLAGQQERLKANFENIKAEIGTKLLPVITTATTAFSNLLSELVEKPEFQTFLDELSVSFEDLLPFVLDLVEGLLELGIDVLPVLADILPTINDLLGLLGTLFESTGNDSNFLQGSLGDLISVIGDTAYMADVLLGSLSDLAVFVSGDENAGAWTEFLDYLVPVTGQLKLLADYAELARIAVEALNGESESQLDLINKIREAARGIPWLAPFVGQNVSFADDRRTALAEGGVVMPRPGGVDVTLAEAGQPEVVIPLDKMNRFGGGGTQITIQGNVGWSPEDLANIIMRKQRQAMSLQGLNGIVGVR